MALITFILDTAASVNRIVRPQRARLRQVGPDSSGLEFIFPFGPQDISFGDFGLSYDTTDRPGGKAIMTAVNQNLRTVSIEAIIADKTSSGKSSIEGRLTTFVRMAEEPYDCVFSYGVITLPYRVRITSVDYTSVRRDTDGNITQAEISFELTENVVINQSIVVLTAITYDPPPKSTSKKGSGSPPPPPGDVDTGFPYYTPGDGSKSRTAGASATQAYG